MTRLLAIELATEAKLLYDLSAEVAEKVAAEVAAEQEMKQLAAEIHAATTLQAAARGMVTRRRGMPLVAEGTVERRRQALFVDLSRLTDRVSRMSKAVGRALMPTPLGSDSGSGIPPDRQSAALRRRDSKMSTRHGGVKSRKAALRLMTSGEERLAHVVAEQPAVTNGLDKWISRSVSATLERRAREARKADAATKIGAGWRRRRGTHQFRRQRQAAMVIQQGTRRRRRWSAEAAAAAAAAAAEEEELLAWEATQTSAATQRVGWLPSPSRRRIDRSGANGLPPSRKEALARRRRQKAELGRRAEARRHILRELVLLALDGMGRAHERDEPSSTDGTALSASLEALLRAPAPWEAGAGTMADGGRATRSLADELERREAAQRLEAGAYVVDAPSPEDGKEDLTLACQPVRSGQSSRSGCCHRRSVEPPSMGHRLWSLLLTLIDESKAEAQQLQMEAGAALAAEDTAGAAARRLDAHAEANADYAGRYSASELAGVRQAEQQRKEVLSAHSRVVAFGSGRELLQRGSHAGRMGVGNAPGLVTV